MSGENTPTDKLQALRERIAAAATSAERIEASLLLADKLRRSDPIAAKSLLEQVMAEAENAGRMQDKGKAAYMLGELLRRAGDLIGAEQCAETVFQVADATFDQRARGRGFNLIGIIQRERNDLQSALGSFKEYLNISRQIGNAQGERIALNELGSVYGLQGKFEEALGCYHQCLIANTNAGDIRGRTISLYNIGWSCLAMGRWTEATENLHRSIALCEEHAFSDPLVAAQLALGELSLKRSDYEAAALMFRTVVEEERARQNSGRTYRESLSDLGWTHFRAGDLARAEEILDEAARLSDIAEDHRGVTNTCCRRAELAIAKGRLDAADELLAQAEHYSTDLKLTAEQGEVLRIKGLLSASLGDSAQALDLFTRSESVLKPLGDTFELALSRLDRGRALVDAQRWDEARPVLQDAARTFRRLAIVAESEEANRLLYRIEMRTDRNTALLQALLSITALGLRPEQFTEQALPVLCDNMQFDGGAVLVGGRPVAILGRPDFAVPEDVTTLSQTDWGLLLPVRDAGEVVGVITLTRSLPLDVRVSPEVLEVVSDTLAPSLVKLRKLKAVETEIGRQIPGLRFRGIAGRNHEALDALELVARTAATRVPVLISGESGTGKELFARALHESSPRADFPFVTVNCAAVAETLLEAEFFGVEAGAATGVAARPGKFELAGKGTIFLDEIGDMSPALQAKLLRAIEEKMVTRVGGTEEIVVEARVVAATNMDLEQREQQGLFRRDLLYRLNTVQLHLPPLRRRTEDIPVLTQYFITRAAQEYNRPVLGAGDDVIAMFTEFPWPGNIRQLQHTVERAVILASTDVLQVADLPSEFKQSTAERIGQAAKSPRSKLHERTEESEKAMLIEALRRAKGNTSEAIRFTGFSERHFYRLLRKHHLSSHTD
jgi:DNA-binding NtrC family response regulator/tetratricopeptide (TPR) repeat protein